MALDNWGTVDRWFAAGKVTTYGPSGIGFVNFGVTREIKLAPQSRHLVRALAASTYTREQLKRPSSIGS
jgi:hypothetical protein